MRVDLLTAPTQYIDYIRIDSMENGQQHRGMYENNATEDGTG
jgi:hypothetical protein